MSEQKRNTIPTPLVFLSVSQLVFGTFAFFLACFQTILDMVNDGTITHMPLALLFLLCSIGCFGFGVWILIYERQK